MATAPKLCAGSHWRIAAGAFFGLLGPNGSGKSTLIGMVSGLVRAPAGRRFVFGHDAVAAAQRARLLLGVDPLYYIVDATRYGWAGVHEGSVATALLVALAIALAVFSLAGALVDRGWRLKP